MKIEWKSCLKIGISVFVLYLCIHFLPVVLDFLSKVIGAAAPLIIGCIVAFLVNILMTFYEKHYFPKSAKRFVLKSRRPVCMIAAFLTLAAIVTLIISLVLPQLINCIKLLLSVMPSALTKAVNRLDELKILPENIIETLNSVNWKSRISEVIGVITSGIGDVANAVINTVTSVFSGIVTALISLIFSVYLLSGKDRLGRQCKNLMKRYMKNGVYVRVMHVLSVANGCFRKFIVGQCTEAVILGALCSLGMLILRIPYANMIGALIAFTALIPVAGAFIGAGVGAFMILTESPVKALVFLIFILILQQLEGNIIYPKVVGSSMGLPGLWVLAAVIIGGGVMGIGGMLIGVPIAATIYKLLREDMYKKKQLE